MNVRKAILRPLLLAAALAIGFGAVWGLAVFWGVGFVEQAAQSNVIEDQIAVRLDGTPVIRSYSRGNYTDSTDRTLQGKLLPPPKYDGGLSCAYLPGPLRDVTPFSRLDWYSRITSSHDGGRPPVYWYLVHDGRLDGRAYFVGYNSKSKSLEGYIGRGGFRTSKPPRDVQFALDGRRMRRGVVMGLDSGPREPYVYRSGDGQHGPFPDWIAHLISEDRLLAVDLRKEQRSVRVVLEAKGLQSVGIATKAPDPALLEDPEPVFRFQRSLAVRGPDRILLRGPGDQQRTYPIPAEIRDVRINFYDLSDSTGLMHATRRSATGGTKHVLLWVDGQGSVIRREEVETGQPSIFDLPGSMANVLSLAVPVPAITTPITVFGFSMDYMWSGEAPNYPTAIAKVISASWPPLLALNLLGIAMAWWCYRRQLRFGQPRVWPWTLFVYLFGVPALLAYLFHRGWPVREVCPSCSQPAPRDRETCFSCAATFPEPTPKGTEVLV